MCTSGTTAEAPVAGSRLQTLIAVLVIAGFAISGAPTRRSSTSNWLALLGASGAAAAADRQQRLRTVLLLPAPRAVGERLELELAPAAGAIVGTLLLVVMLSQLGSLLGGTSGSATPYLLPMLILLVAVIGFAWASYCAQPAVRFTKASVTGCRTARRARRHARHLLESHDTHHELRRLSCKSPRRPARAAAALGRSGRPAPTPQYDARHENAPIPDAPIGLGACCVSRRLRLGPGPTRGLSPNPSSSRHRVSHRGGAAPHRILGGRRRASENQRRGQASAFTLSSRPRGTAGRSKLNRE